MLLSVYSKLDNTMSPLVRAQVSGDLAVTGSDACLTGCLFGWLPTCRAPATSQRAERANRDTYDVAAHAVRVYLRGAWRHSASISSACPCVAQIKLD